MQERQCESLSFKPVYNVCHDLVHTAREDNLIAFFNKVLVHPKINNND